MWRQPSVADSTALLEGDRLTIQFPDGKAIGVVLVKFASSLDFDWESEPNGDWIAATTKMSPLRIPAVETQGELVQLRLPDLVSWIIGKSEDPVSPSWSRVGDGLEIRLLAAARVQGVGGETEVGKIYFSISISAESALLRELLLGASVIDSD